MKYHRLEVEHFGCVRQAAVDLGPGLNVLYGPNELGKSTLARALRAVLLVPHTSRVAEDYTSWFADKPPLVRLVFETADHQVWRVEKYFGNRAGGAARLEQARDGRTYVEHARGREVDGALRGLLGWGVASPASSHAPRGLPESFLATVLLAEQGDVSGVLKQTLASDSDDSGRAALTRALAALAQDPLYKSVLDRAQGHTNDAYTATGHLTRGRHSPFRIAQGELTRAREVLTQAERKVEEIAQARAALARSQGEAARAAGEVAVAAAHCAATRDALARAQARADADRAHSGALADLAHCQAEADVLEQRTAQLARARADANTAATATVAATAALDAARVAVATAEADRRRAESAEEEASRRLCEVELERQQLELTAEATARDATHREVVSGRNASVALREATLSAATAEVERSGASAAVRTALADREAAAARMAVLELAATLVARQQAQAALDALAAERARAEIELTAAGAARERAAQLARARDPRLPSPDALMAMQALNRELELAEAACAGLVVAVERLEAVTVEMEVDGERRASPLGPLFQVDAAHTVQLRLGDVARIAITAGDPHTRERAHDLRARWRAEAAPLLAPFGLDLHTLAARVAAGVAREQQIADALALAEACAARAARHGVREEEATRYQAELDAHTRVLAGRPIEEANLVLSEDGASGVPAALERARAKRDAAARAVDESTERLHRAEAAWGAREERVAAARRRCAESVPAPEDGWDEALERLDVAEQNAIRKRGVLDHARTELGSARAALMTRTDAALRAAEALFVEADVERQALMARLERVRAEAARLEGEVETRRATVGALDLPGARAREEAARACRDELPEGVPGISADGLADADRRLERARLLERHALDELRRAEGAHETVGGQVAEDEAEQAREAYAAAELASHEVEVEYAAWRMLTEALRAAENTEGRHLGEALGVPVGARFAALTAGRYERSELGADLAVHGVVAGGVLRTLDRLSEGARDQLATLLRLTVAAQLDCALVLDDHLVQADPDRSRWFARELLAHAAHAQVLVLTCDPLRYMDPADLAASGEIEAIRAGGLLRGVNLARVIERAKPHP